MSFAGNMKQKVKQPLPIDPYLDQILKASHDHPTLLIKASPGSGKTTRLPWALASGCSQKVIVLEPRRLAAKLAALRIAEEEDLKAGEEIGFHFRFEKNVSSQSRLIFYTEGTFLRIMTQDPELKDVGIVILDEFHERHLETDMALAALRTLQKRRPDLKIILMSATLDTSMLEYFENPKVIEIEAPRFPVEIHHLPNIPSVLNQKLEVKVRNALREIPPEGDVLVFLPGMREMLQTQELLGEEFGDVFILHADLSKEEQARTLGPHPKRKIILATNIAESSVTIPGIRFVIDSGIQREAHYSPWTGLKTLIDRPITQSSAIQRTGRAGRTSAGVCFRLYAEMDYKERAPYTIPEILTADLTDTVLLAAQMKGELEWVTPPIPERWQKARELAYRLGAIDEAGHLTNTGSEIIRYPLDTRLGRILQDGQRLTKNAKKKLLQFIAQEIEGDRSGQLLRRLHFYFDQDGEAEDWERSLLTGFIDQVARFRRKQNDFIHFSGKTLKVHNSLSSLHEGLYLILDVSARMEAMLIFPIEEEWLFDIEPFPFTEEEVISVTDRISIRSQTKLGSLIFDETTKEADWNTLRPEQKAKVVELTSSPFKKLWMEWKGGEKFERYAYWARQQGVSLEELEDSLSPENYFSEYQTMDFSAVDQYFEQMIQGELQVSSLERELPLSIHLGGKRELTVHYPLGMDPFVEAPIQDFYGQKKTPSIMNGKIPLTIKLLGPHKRPIQVTKDLSGFWERTYPQMKKEYQRDYPRHYWPDDPANAQPILLKRQLPQS